MSTALLGVAFVACTLLVAGLPPLAGFIGKFAMLSALLQTPQADDPVAASRWILLALIVASGLMALIALSRTGMRFFWAPVARAAPLAACRRSRAHRLAAGGLCAHQRAGRHAGALCRRHGVGRCTSRARYIEAVFAARPLPSPTRTDARPAPQPGAVR